jgi:hypothetical protein
LVHEKIRSRLNSGDADHSVQNLLFSRQLCESVKIKIYKTIILDLDLYGCETCPLTLRKEYTRMVFEKRVLRRIVEPKRTEGIGGWKNCIMRSFINFALRHVILE